MEKPERLKALASIIRGAVNVNHITVPIITSFVLAEALEAGADALLQAADPAALEQDSECFARYVVRDGHVVVEPGPDSPAAALERENPSCARCGGPHPFDTTVPSVVWNGTIRRLGLEDYLCLTCIVRAFASQGVSFTAELVGGPFHFLPIEIRINSQDAKDAAAISEENTRLRARIQELDAALSASPIPPQQKTEAELPRDGTYLHPDPLSPIPPQEKKRQSEGNP